MMGGLYGLVLASLVAGSVAANAQGASQGIDRFAGKWEGAVQAGLTRLRMGLELDRDSTGGLRGVMISVDQANTRLPSTVSVRGDTVSVVMSASSATYRATINASRDTLHGTLLQGAPLSLDFHRVQVIGQVLRPQEPKPPFPYGSRDVSFESVPGVRLAGTITLPAGTGPFPGVVLVTGSGPQNRDEEVMGHKPFLLLADYLARHGIASLRYDDRGIGKSTGHFQTSTSEDFAKDAEAALHVLRGDGAIAANHVGIIGHSEGGLIAPMIAARSKDVAFLVLLAGPGVRGDSILMLQQQLLGAAAGMSPQALQTAAGINRMAYSIVKSGGDSAMLKARLDSGVRAFVATMPAYQQSEAVIAQLQQQMAPALTPWLRYFLASDPAPTLRQVHVPVLALNGTLDLQVPYKEDLNGISTALQAAGNRDFRVVELPGLNHLFQTARTGSVVEYAEITETISPAVLDLISKWINQRFGSTSR